MNIYVVIGHRLSRSGSEKWIVSAYQSKERAKHHANLAQSEWNTVQSDMRRSTAAQFRNQSEVALQLDPEHPWIPADVVYSVIREYSIVECELIA